MQAPRSRAAFPETGRAACARSVLGRSARPQAFPCLQGASQPGAHGSQLFVQTLIQAVALLHLPRDQKLWFLLKLDPVALMSLVLLDQEKRRGLRALSIGEPARRTQTRGAALGHPQGDTVS